MRIKKYAAVLLSAVTVTASFPAVSSGDALPEEVIAAEAETAGEEQPEGDDKNRTDGDDKEQSEEDDKEQPEGDGKDRTDGDDKEQPEEDEEKRPGVSPLEAVKNFFRQFDLSGESASYSRKTYPLYVGVLGNKLEIPLYFVDGVTDLPFVNLSDWIDLMVTVNKGYRGDEDYGMSAEMDGPCVLCTRENGYSMLVDFKERTITFEDYDAFLHRSWEGSLFDQVSYNDRTEDGDAILIKHSAKGSFDRYGKEVTLYLEDYDIPQYWSEEEELYLVPLQTMSDFLLSADALLSVFFNEEAVFVASESSFVQDDERTELGEVYFSAPRADMSEELAWFSYCELCLAMDNLYGLKEQHGIRSFDSLFDETGYKEDLMSTDPEIADGALLDFIKYYLDDLHSGFALPSYRTNVVASLGSDGLSSLQSDADEELFRQARMSVDREIPAYEEVGNTAFITFDHFLSFRGPDEYYEAEIELPEKLPEDSLDIVDLLLYAHKQITRENSPIENVVLDLSNNTGGYLDVACITAAWFLKEARISIKSTFTEARSTGSYQADLNLDHKYDESDTVADKNLFCLISPVSFSCGNLVPNIYKASHRVTILGQTSGGGSCSVMPLSTAYGSCFQISSPYNMSMVKNGSYYGIDAGVEPDVYIVKPEHFYDREGLADYINNLF